MRNIKIFPKSEIELNLLLGLLSLIALLAAYLSELLGYKPCILCIYQRIPYFIILPATLFTYFCKPSHQVTLYIKYLIIALLLAEVGIAFYHVLIEYHLIEETSLCHSQLRLSEDITEALEQIKSTETVTCANPELFIFGFSMAEWNCLYSLFLLIISLKFRGKNAPGR